MYFFVCVIALKDIFTWVYQTDHIQIKMNTDKYVDVCVCVNNTEYDCEHIQLFNVCFFFF